VRRYGQWVRLDARKLKVGRYLFARHGRKIVFFGRLTIVVALVMDRTIRRLEVRAAAAFPDPLRDSTWSTCSATLM